MSRRSRNNVLKYQKGRGSQGTVKKQYMMWRLRQDPPIPIRCDNFVCQFYQSPMRWNGKLLEPILDHKYGVNGDNRPENLQLLCPNCNSQQPTHGGRNRDKVRQSTGGFAKTRNEGGWDYEMPLEPLAISIELSQVQATRPPQNQHPEDE